MPGEEGERTQRQRKRATVLDIAKDIPLYLDGFTSEYLREIRDTIDSILQNREDREIVEEALF